MSDFSTAKVGDEVWTIRKGCCEVEALDISKYPIKAGGDWYTQDGRIYQTDVIPSLYWSDPHIVAPEKPKRMVEHREEGFINIYPDGQKCFHKEKEQAEKSAGFCKIAVPAVLTYTTEE